MVVTGGGTFSSPERPDRGRRPQRWELCLGDILQDAQRGNLPMPTTR